jgi:hypothetical protein
MSGYARAVDSSNFTPEQGRKLAETVGPMLGYLHRLAHWMQRMAWKPDDPLYVAAWQAHQAMHRLHSTRDTRAASQARPGSRCSRRRGD